MLRKDMLLNLTLGSRRMQLNENGIEKWFKSISRLNIKEFDWIKTLRFIYIWKKTKILFFN